jgi:ABC-type lipoprotein release transport system permease subunit
MNVVWSISFRNLIRQKRRNILLGIAIAFGTAILILANAFSHGISEVMFNRVLKYVAGHVSVGVYERGNYMRQIMRDGDWMMDLAKKEIPDITQIQEAIGIFARGLGNGKSDNVIMVGIDLDSDTTKQGMEDAMSNFPMAEGKFDNIRDTSNGQNPVLISESKAKYLNLKMGDILRVRYTNVLGQNQSAMLNIVGIVKPANVFMEAPVYLNVWNLKKIAGYGPHDIGQLYITMKEPKKNAIKYADHLHSLLKPSMAAIGASISSKTGAIPGTVTGFRSDSAGRVAVLKSLPATPHDTTSQFFKKGVLVSDSLACALSVKAGDSITITFMPKYLPDSVRSIQVVTGTLGGEFAKEPVAVINDNEFYRLYYETTPMPDSLAVGKIAALSPAIREALTPTWFLMDRSRSTKDMTKRIREIAGRKYKALIVDVQTMYESASMILQVESALNIITFSAVMILFFIILIGVINTLRMTIRERTREIGTIRAIGMQTRDVRNSFLVETGMLAFFSAIAGTAMAFIAMWGLSAIKMKTEGNPLSMLLVSGHLFFAPTVTAVIGFIILIIAIAVITAWFPARKAAKMSAAAALRHYE